VIVNSEFVKRTCVLAGIEPSKISVAYLPPAHELLDMAGKMDITKSKLNETKVILFVGTFSERKGIDLVLKIAQICKSRKLKYRFVVIGSWSGMSTSFEKEFTSMSNIEIIPWVTRDELAEHYARADFLFCPTRADGGARVITESMLFGDVVLTTTVSGSPITSGFDGFEFELTHDDSFLEEVLEVLENGKIADEVGMRAIRTVSVDLSFNNYMKNVLNCCAVT
jgi:glycosyltransferase involved in cell wall biosynthesis